MTNARPHATREELAELESVREEIVKRNADDYEIYLHAVERLQSRSNADPKSAAQSADTAISYPSIDGLIYKFELRSSDVLWVVLRDSVVPEERFSENRLAANVAGCVLEARPLNDRFDQTLVDGLAKIVNRIVKDRQIQRIIYVGFSAGADAALVMASRNPRATRVLAFGPQLQFGQDMVDEVNSLVVRTDILLGVHDYHDGAIIARSFDIHNDVVARHYLRVGHSVDFELDRNGSLRSILAYAYEGAAVEFPDGVRAGDHEARLSVRVYELSRALESGEQVAVPDDDEGSDLNPQWWNVKSRIRAGNGDVAGAIADIVRAIMLDPEADSHYVCAGNYFRSAGLKELAEASYRRAADVNPGMWRPGILLAGLYLEHGLAREASDALTDAVLRGAPRDRASGIAAQIPAAERSAEVALLAEAAGSTA